MTEMTENTNHHVTIQLNGDALERLIGIGGGDEFVVSLKRAVLEKALSAKASSVIGDELTKRADEQVRKALMSYTYPVKDEPDHVVREFRDRLDHVMTRAGEQSYYAMNTIAEEAAAKAADRHVKEFRDRFEGYIGKITKDKIEGIVIGEINRRWDLLKVSIHKTLADHPPTIKLL